MNPRGGKMLTSRHITRLAGFWSCALALNAPAQTPTPVGVEFQVNTYTTEDQISPSVAMDADGDFVVVWTSEGSAGTDTDLSSIQGRRYAADGVPLAGELQINTYTTGEQSLSEVGVAPDGDFVAVWRSFGSVDGDPDHAVSGRRFASDGSPLGDDFQVNTYTTGLQGPPAVAVGGDGDFVVVWDSPGSFGDDDSQNSIQGQRYDSHGRPNGGQFQVNSVTEGIQRGPDIAISPSGDFMVVWYSDSSAGDDASQSIQAQLYAADGMPLGGQFQVNTATLGRQDRPAVAVDGDGDFVIVWDSADSPPDLDLGIRGRRYASDGAPLGDEFLVNSYLEGPQLFSDVAVDTAGNFVVVWNSALSDGPDAYASIQGQRFLADGTPHGAEFQINTYTTGGQYSPSVGGLSEDGRFAVVWYSEGSAGTDDSFFSVQGQRFDSPLFSDGFESGDATAWPEVVGIP